MPFAGIQCDGFGTVSLQSTIAHLKKKQKQQKLLFTLPESPVCVSFLVHLIETRVFLIEIYFGEVIPLVVFQWLDH